MPTIALTDKLGLDVDAQLAPTAALLRYVHQVPSLRFDDLDLRKLGGLTLDQPAIQSLSTGVSFQDPVDFAGGTFTAVAGAHGSIKVICDADDLSARDDSIELPAGDCYFSFGIEAAVSAGASITSGKFQFGATPSTDLQAQCYLRFPLQAGVTLIEALQQTVAGFSLPLNSEDLGSLAAGQIVQVAVEGKLSLSGAANLLAITNPLASASLPAPLPAVSVSAGGSATIGVSCAIEMDYEIVARRLEGGAVRLGWYHKGGTDVKVSAQVSEGLSAGFGTTDLFSEIVRVISTDPQADLKELANAGVPVDQAAAIQAAVKAATSRKLEIAVATELSAGVSRSANFLYDIIPSALTKDSQQAVDNALCGDLTALHAEPLPGITCVRSVWDNVRTRGLELDVNLLGILNYRSIATLSIEGKVLCEPATGALVITDQATANRIRSTQVDWGADTQKLRHVLAESFLITAAYHAAKGMTAATLQCSHSFFELQNATSRGDMLRKIQTGVVLGLLSGDEAKLPEGASAFGRTLFVVSADYDDALVQGMFLDANGFPLSHETYESVGRNAIQFLVQPDDGDAVRRQPAIDDDLWRRMKREGQPGFAGLFPGVSTALLGAITADYSTIQWWAGAMRNTARQLAAFQLWTAQHPAAAAGDPEFQKLREDLAKYLLQVAADTREEFGQPWGLIAMNQLASRRAGGKILITGPTLVVNKRRARAAVTGP
jgi:hypothetical protein